MLKRIARHTIKNMQSNCGAAGRSICHQKRRKKKANTGKTEKDYRNMPENTIENIIVKAQNESKIRANGQETTQAAGCTFESP